MQLREERYFHMAVILAPRTPISLGKHRGKKLESAHVQRIKNRETIEAWTSANYCLVNTSILRLCLSCTTLAAMHLYQPAKLGALLWCLYISRYQSCSIEKYASRNAVMCWRSFLQSTLSSLCLSKAHQNNNAPNASLGDTILPLQLYNFFFSLPLPTN